MKGASTPMAYSVTSALVGSLIVSLTLVPLLCLVLLQKRPPERENAVVRWTTRVYRPVLGWALAQRGTVVVVVRSRLLAVSLGLATRIGSEFLPELNEGAIWVNFNMPPSISVREAQAQMQHRTRSSFAASRRSPR